MIHGLIALVTCGVLYLAGFAWSAMFWPAAFYMGRELAQSEYRYIEAHGKKRANCPWYCGFCPSAWTLKGFLDFALAWLVGVGFAVLAYLLPF